MRHTSFGDPLFRSVTAMLTGVVSAFFLGGCGAAPHTLDEIRDLQKNQRFEESLNPLMRLVEGNTDNSEVYLIYGNALIRTGAPSRALWPLRRAMEDPEFALEAANLMAQGAMRTGNVESAVDHATAALEIEPDNIEALTLRSLARAHSRRDYEGAVADADRVLELDPENPDVLVPRTVALLGLDRTEEAAEALQQLEDHQRDQILGFERTAHLCATRSIFARENGDPEEADKILEACLEEFPSAQPAVREGIARADQEQDFEKAVAILETALASDSAWEREYRVNLSDRLRALGRPEEAESRLQDAIDKNTDPALTPLFWSDLGSHYFELQNHQAAADAVGKALEASPSPPPQDLIFDYTELLLLSGRYDEAFEFSKQIEIPAYREFMLARGHLLQGRPAEALKHFDAGHALWPDGAISRYYTARAAESLGDIDRAIHEYRYSMRIDPRGTDARFRLAKIYESMGQFEAAATTAGFGGGNQMPDPPAQIYQVRVLSEAGRIDLVELILKQALLQPAPVPTLAVVAAAEGLRKSRNSAWALAMLSGMEGLDLREAENAPLLRARIELLGDLGRTDEALREAEASLRAQPNEANFHAIYGLALAQHGAEAEKIRGAYLRALEVDSSHTNALFGLAELSLNRSDFDTALAFNQRLLETQAENLTALEQRARIFHQSGNSQESEVVWEQILEQNPMDANALNALLTLRTARGASDEERTAALTRRVNRIKTARRAETAPAAIPAPDKPAADVDPEVGSATVNATDEG